ncbi:MAG TPA: methyltransferase [Candidatus Saccharimonadaceae bacterium]|jgi:protein-S-isoprenylcysteine O-methyltransferase Ste14|nr:methyltransferase [Candidatus Saccharimonadaceae bacterium]
MFALVRALVYAVLFMGFTLVFLPGQVLRWAGVTRPAHLGAAQFAGVAVEIVGVALALWCIVTFALIGRGTPFPIDPPRRLVVAGPYRYVRNPMYWGAGLALAGAAIFYRSIALAGYALLFVGVMHLFVTLIEERVLGRSFGAEYAEYRRRVRRWWPRRPEERESRHSTQA